MALNRHERAAGTLMDLSKEFECLLHTFLVAGLEAYGISTGAVDLLVNISVVGNCSLEWGPIQGAVKAF